MAPPIYTGPERRRMRRDIMRQHQFTDDEIAMWSRQPPEDVIRLIFLAMNKVVGTIDEQHSVLVEHVRANDAVQSEIEEIGGIVGIRKRADFVDALIKRNEEQAGIFADLRRRLATGGAITALKVGGLVFLVLLIFYWNGHTPDQMHLPMPSSLKLPSSP